LNKPKISMDGTSSSDGPASHRDRGHPNRLLPPAVLRLRCRYLALRHGQSEANVRGIIASNPDVACASYGLSPAGIQQAQRAGEDFVRWYLGEFGSSRCRDGDGDDDSVDDGDEGRRTRGRRVVPAVAILTSDLLRARETSELVRDAIVAHNGRVQREGGGSGDSSGATVIPVHTGDVIVETRLRERGFGEWDLTSDANYQRVWDDDAIDSSTSRRSVEPVDSVMRRATAAVAEWDQALPEGSGAADAPPAVVICVAHGDVLQILQTAFQKMDGTLHRTLPHLETATLRPLILKD
jgi:probable phosphoglycerate mutase